MKLPALTEAELSSGPDGAAAASTGLHKKTPLWYYILKESEALHQGETLGPVGSTLLAEVFVGLLRADADSYVSVNPAWIPTLPAATAGQFTMTDLFRYLPPEALNPNGGDTGAA